MPHSSLAATSTHFEFTKRKRYADLLITELSDAIVLLLSTNGKVYFCGPAVTELLGWNEDEWIDEDIGDYIHSDDCRAFMSTFRSCAQGQTELIAFVRLRRKSALSPAVFGAHNPHDSDRDAVLFEVKGYTKVLSNGTACFFAVAKPYPSRNVAMLSTFLELKMENEKLQERLNALRSGSAVVDVRPTLPSVPYSTSPTYYHPQNIGMPNSLAGAFSVPSQMGGSRDFFSSGYSDYMPQPSNLQGWGASAMYGMLSAGPGVSVSRENVPDAVEEPTKKRKLSKLTVNTATQHVCVTCGRTDSPEWRKGPQGPKTLCNACGLRWAKESRKPADSSDIVMGGFVN